MTTLSVVYAQAKDTLPGIPYGQVFIGPIRVAEGGRTRIYQQLSAEGRFVTRGILFGTGSDRTRPDSTPTLEEIAQMMGAHPDLRLRGEGHTHNVGAVNATRKLSQKRAEAVVDYLTGEKGIAVDRLEAVGLGAAVPAPDKATPEGRQTNWRVELVLEQEACRERSTSR